MTARPNQNPGLTRNSAGEWGVTSAIVIPPHNDVDIHAHDLGFVAHLNKGGEIEGYTVLAGGGFGMDHGKVATYPFLSVPV